MKKYFNIAIAMLIAAGLSTSCKDYLDINDNPNAATYVEPQLVLPTAIVRSAGLSNSYNTYGGSLGGYIANAGGFSGFGNLLTYAFTPGTHSQWGTAYDTLLDYKYVLDGSADDNNLANFHAIAKIMMAFEYSRIVDQHGDIPYSEALLGSANLTPKYDAATDIYQDLINQLDDAISIIDNASFPLTLDAKSDPMFQGNMTNWKRFANTVKLRLLIRISGSSLSSFAQQKLASFNNSLGLITEDAVVNPGYENQSGKVNPTWGTWGYSTNGNVATTSRVPTYFIYGFYDGTKLSDNFRGSKIFNDFGNSSRPTPLNQLGVESGNPPIRSGFSPWYNGQTANVATDGVVKAPTAGQPIILLAEAHFLKAEAQLKGFLPGDAKASFEEGIKASFRYLAKNGAGVVPASFNATTELNNYKVANSSSYLVQFDSYVTQGGETVATTAAQKLEAIITQKYIAFNMITGEEAWNDYRRTGYPVTTPGGGRYLDMASTTSVATTPDRLPTILKYPQSEYNYNSTNVKDVNHFGDKLFWAK